MAAEGGRAYPAGVLERLQGVERDILAQIDQVCRAAGITYYLDSGTCLGAVRHGGFIPWDDDADVAMPYQDYLRFRELAPQMLPEGYSLHDCRDTPGFPALWTKVFRDGTRFLDENALEAGCPQAIFVDVFPVFRLEADGRAARRQRAACTYWQRMSYLHCLAHPKVPRTAPLRPLLELGCSVAHATVAMSWTPALCQGRLLRAAMADAPGSRWFSPCYASAALEGAWLFPTRDVAFDGLTLRAPRDCDAYLTEKYGDWHRLPPAEDRYTHLPRVLDFGDGINVMGRA